MADLTSGIPVEFKVNTWLLQAGQEETFEFSEMGQAFKMGSTLYLRYHETADGQSIPVTMKIQEDGDVQLRRHSENDLRLVFSPNTIKTTKYRTPMGLMDITTLTQRLDVEFFQKPFAGKVAIDYQLLTGEEVVGQHKIRLQFTA
ncbi:DUF1934 domain-containing protein [Periweissella cryptocerci]|uniref:DUF1934 domain-containing protein n=1 Tax=Periweissella cryptocerci TaxID=2506420 RepID=A0A4P6YUJ2_9LACO|nr:DUF1934 domain-containing protein [Periweissella cryptocerci]QBO36448.1 DUF1934 domain-containing protein [Periweissella cryptocerci]